MEEPTSFEQETKPQGLKILCTLTFIYSGFTGFFALLGMIFARPFYNWLNEHFSELESKSQLSETQLEQLKTLLEKGSSPFIISCGIFLLVVGLSFFGALQMWQNKYRGLVMYLVANMYFLVSNIVGGGFIMAAFDLLFIILYTRHVKSLER